MSLFRVVDFISKGLDGSTIRHSVLSNNLANANTPRFKRSDLNFAQQLSESQAKSNLNRTHKNHLVVNNNRSQFKIYQDDNSIMRNDQNNVDVEREMAYLMENQLHYQAMSDMVNRQLSLLRSVIKS